MEKEKSKPIPRLTGKPAGGGLLQKSSGRAEVDRNAVAYHVHHVNMRKKATRKSAPFAQLLSAISKLTSLAEKEVSSTANVQRAAWHVYKPSPDWSGNKEVQELWTAKFVSNLVLYDFGRYFLTCNVEPKKTSADPDFAQAVERHRMRLQAYERLTEVGSTEPEVLEREAVEQLEKANALLVTFKNSVDRDTEQFAAATNQALGEVRTRLARMRGLEVNS